MTQKSPFGHVGSERTGVGAIAGDVGSVGAASTPSGVRARARAWYDAPSHFSTKDSPGATVRLLRGADIQARRKRPLRMTPRLVGIAVSGAIHATVFASLAFTTPRTPETGPRAAETSLILETQEDAPTPPAPTPPAPTPPIAPKSSEAREAHHHPPVQSPAAAAPNFLARFMMAIPATAGNAPDPRGEGGLGTVADREGTAADPMPETTYGEDEVSTPATLLSNSDATYPTEAWSSGVEADVPVEIVVDARGSVVSARVVTRAGHGFDDAALASIQSYRFAAAQRDGRAVRVRVRWSIQFRLRR